VETACGGRDAAEARGAGRIERREHGRDHVCHGGQDLGCARAQVIVRALLERDPEGTQLWPTDADAHGPRCAAGIGLDDLGQRVVRGHVGVRGEQDPLAARQELGDQLCHGPSLAGAWRSPDVGDLGPEHERDGPRLCSAKLASLGRDGRRRVPAAEEQPQGELAVDVVRGAGDGLEP
jgi:hypothetical protein